MRMHIDGHGILRQVSFGAGFIGVCLPERLMGRHWRELVPADEAARLSAICRRILPLAAPARIGYVFTAGPAAVWRVASVWRDTKREFHVLHTQQTLAANEEVIGRFGT